MRFLIFLLTAVGAIAQVIPPTNRIDWATVGIGVPGGPVARSAIFTNVVTAGADNTGATDCSTIIQNLLSLCPSNQVMYFPSGQYLFKDRIQFLNSSGITWRGDGMTNTTLIDGITNSSPNGFINVGVDNPQAPVNISSASRGASSIVVADATGFAVGKMVIITQTNDPAFVYHFLGTDRVLRQQCRITSVSGTTIGIEPPLFWTFSLAPQAILLPTVSYYCGFENMTITHSNALTGVLGQSASSIFATQCYGMWVTNVESSWAKNRHLYFINSMNKTIRHNFIHEAQAYGPNQGVGVEGIENLCFSLIEDNIFVRCFPSIMMSTASSGNVIIYNFSDDVRTGTTIVGSDYDNNHGSHTMFNLWEGNIGVMFQSDGYYGSSSHSTAFRNFFKAVHPSLTEGLRAVSLERGTRYYNIVGNILGHPSIASGTWVYNQTANAYSYTVPVIIRMGYPHMGNNGYNEPTQFPTDIDGFDPAVATTTLLEGNYDYKNNAQVWSGAPLTLPDSYFYASKPSYFGSLTWPPINPASPSTNYAVIPAGYRYVNGTDPGGGSGGGIIGRINAALVRAGTIVAP